MRWVLVLLYGRGVMPSHSRMYFAVVPKRGARPAILPRDRYRDGGKVKNRTPQESLGLGAVAWISQSAVSGPTRSIKSARTLA